MRSTLVVCGSVALAVVLGAAMVAQAQSSTVGKLAPAAGGPLSLDSKAPVKSSTVAKVAPVHTKVATSRKPVVAMDTTAAAKSRFAAKSLYAKKHPGYIATSVRSSKLTAKGKTSTSRVSATKPGHKVLAARKGAATTSLKTSTAAKTASLKSSAAAPGTPMPVSAWPAPPKTTSLKSATTPKTAVDAFSARSPYSSAPAARMPMSPTERPVSALPPAIDLNS